MKKKSLSKNLAMVLMILITITIGVAGINWYVNVNTSHPPTTTTPIPKPVLSQYPLTFTVLSTTRANGRYEVLTTVGQILYFTDFNVWDKMIPRNTYTATITGSENGAYDIGTVALVGESYHPPVSYNYYPVDSNYYPTPYVTYKYTPQYIQTPTNTVYPSTGTLPLEQQIHNLINQQRNANGLSSLGFDQSLSTIARSHSQDMAQNNYFAHENLQGLDPTARGKQGGYSCYKNYGSYYTYGLGENIYTFSEVNTVNGVPVGHNLGSSESLAQATVNSWMNSQGHRENILTSTYNREGIGVAYTSDGGAMYVTEDFC